MRLNADFSAPVAINARDHEWIHSPEAGVDRIMLDRIGDEVARATSIVRYAPGSRFARHEHACGEEFLVLEGTFSDEHGDYATGTYVRNPPGSGHSPFSTSGCRILVKLRQFDPRDLEPVVIDTTDRTRWRTTDQIEFLALHEYATEVVQMLGLPTGKTLNVKVGSGGVEMLVVSGSVKHANDVLGAESWLRQPAGTTLSLFATTATTLWVKSGHLPPV